jgi:hypothetical protein
MMADPVALVLITTVDVSTIANDQADPLYTFKRFETVLKYKSPADSALPSLSKVGSVENAPR